MEVEAVVEVVLGLVVISGVVLLMVGDVTNSLVVFLVVVLKGVVTVGVVL